MNIYIWEYLDKVSNSYHSDGGVVVFADTEEEARKMANYEDGCVITLDKNPSHTVKCEDVKKQVLIFPNAGCC